MQAQDRRVPPVILKKMASNGRIFVAANNSSPTTPTPSAGFTVAAASKSAPTTPQPPSPSPNFIKCIDLTDEDEDRRNIPNNSGSNSTNKPPALVAISKQQQQQQQPQQPSPVQYVSLNKTSPHLGNQTRISVQKIGHQYGKCFYMVDRPMEKNIF